MRVDVITIFPDLFGPYLAESMLGIARQKNLLDIHIHNLRDHTADKHKSVDDRPYGGGPGMVMMCGPVFTAVETIEQQSDVKSRRILLTPSGQPFTQKKALELSREPRLLLLCGHYEGFDERIHIGINAEEISIGDYVLTGGELPALVIIDAVTRLIPGVLGHEDSARLDSFSDIGGMLDYPQYTRPAEFRGMKVPEVLQNGNHRAIAEWRREHSLQRTRQRRPDILEKV